MSDEIERLRRELHQEVLRGPYDHIDITRFNFAEKESSKPEIYETPELPLNKRFEGMWVVGSQGSGKTQFFKRQLKLDLDMVAAGKASLFILDPTGDQPE